MRILAIDAATKCGFAWGLAGSKPTVKLERLRDPEDEEARAARRLGKLMRDLFEIETFDLAVIEAPLDPAVAARMQTSNNRTVKMLQRLPGAVHAVAACYGARSVEVNVQAVRKHFLGVARPADPKKAVIAQCHRLGLLDPACRDDNIADAIALHVYASDVWGRPARRDLVLTPERVFR